MTFASSTARAIALFVLGTAAACGDNLSAVPGEGQPDAGAVGDEPDAAAPDAAAANPFDVETERTWTWVPIEGNRCMDGSATGIAVNLNLESDKVVIFMQGGGACFNTLSCVQVANPDGFGPAEMDDQVTAGVGSVGIMDREDPNNPLADWNYVFIPYCTGDVHAGANEEGIGGRIMVGYANVTNAVTRLRDEFAGRALTQALVTGMSAGGFGAAYNYDQVQGILDDGVQVDLLDDSGPALSDTYLTPCLQVIFREAWNLEATGPADCTECVNEQGGGFVNMMTFLSEKYPDGRMGLITSMRDATIRQFFAFGYPNCEEFDFPMDADIFAAGVAELRDVYIEPLDNAAAYTIESDNHVWSYMPLGSVEVSGVTMGQWITDLVDHNRGWESVAPPDK